MMNRFKLAFLASVSLSLFACVGSATAPADDDAARASALESGQRSHAKQVEVDAGLDGTQRPTRVALSVDGQTCTLDPTKDTVGLDRGLDGHGWAMQVYVEQGCGGGLILNIQGVDDAPYPQTRTIPFLREEGAILFASEPELGSDVDGGGGVFRASNPGGHVTIASGPSVETTTFTIAGEAKVTSDADPTHVRTVTFDLDF